MPQNYSIEFIVFQIVFTIYQEFYSFRIDLIWHNLVSNLVISCSPWINLSHAIFFTHKKYFAQGVEHVAHFDYWRLSDGQCEV